MDDPAGSITGDPALATGALRQAITRFISVQGPSVAATDIFPSAVESLFWARVADERFERLDPTYRERRDADPDGAVLHGIRWVRNAATHELALPFAYHDGLSWPVTFPTTWGDFRWHPTSQAGGRASDTRGQQAYDDGLAERPLKLTLWAAERWLQRQLKPGGETSTA